MDIEDRSHRFGVPMQAACPRQVALVLGVWLFFSFTGRAVNGQQLADTGLKLLQDCRVALELERDTKGSAGDANRLERSLLAMSCVAFVDGMIAMNGLYEDWVVDRDRINSNHVVGLVCFPRDGAVIDAVRAVVNHLETQPMKQLESLSRRNAAHVALATAYRCTAARRLGDGSAPPKA